MFRRWPSRTHSWLAMALCFVYLSWAYGKRLYILVGAILAVGVGALASGSIIAMVFGFLALILAAINIFGGFMVTSRMLAMYKKKDK